MTVAIVVLNYNGNDDTVECLRSLRAVRNPEPRIYVVDNGSVPPIRPRLEAEKLDVRLIENRENLGFTGGNNVGTQAALQDGARYVLLLNNDTAVDPGFLGPLVGALQADPGLGIVTPKIYFHGQDRVFWAHGARVDRWTGRSPHIGVYEKDQGQCDHIRDVERVTGCAMMARRELLESVGLLDNRFFIYSEETDWCLRARRAGYRLAVVKESVIWHHGHRDSGRAGRPFIAYLQTRNHLLMLRKNSNYFVAGGAFALLYFVAAFAWQLGRAIPPWVLKRDPAWRNYARAVVWGAIDYWRGHWGPPPPEVLGRRHRLP